MSGPNCRRFHSRSPRSASGSCRCLRLRCRSSTAAPTNRPSGTRRSPPPRPARRSTSGTPGGAARARSGSRLRAWLLQEVRRPTSCGQRDHKSGRGGGQGIAHEWRSRQRSDQWRFEMAQVDTPSARVEVGHGTWDVSCGYDAAHVRGAKEQSDTARGRPADPRPQAPARCAPAHRGRADGRPRHQQKLRPRGPQGTPGPRHRRDQTRLRHLRGPRLADPARRRPHLPHPHPARGRRGRAGRDPPGTGGAGGRPDSSGRCHRHRA